MSTQELLTALGPVGLAALGGYAWLIRLGSRVGGLHSEMNRRFESANSQRIADLQLLAAHREADSLLNRERFENIQSTLSKINVKLDGLDGLAIAVTRMHKYMASGQRDDND